MNFQVKKQKTVWYKIEAKLCRWSAYIISWDRLIIKLVLPNYEAEGLGLEWNGKEK